MEGKKTTGSYSIIEENYINEIHENFGKLDKIEGKFYKKNNMNRLNGIQSELKMKESVVARYLGFDEFNVKFQGFDCARKSKNKIFDKEYLEVKNCSINSKNWRAIFNDATYRIANNYKRKNVYVALAMWNNFDLEFIVYGQDVKIGTYISNKVTDFISKNKNRSYGLNVGISISRFVNYHNFDIYAVDYDADMLYNKLRKSNYLKKHLSRSRVHDIKELNT
jgi:hypothetical protein